MGTGWWRRAGENRLSAMVGNGQNREDATAADNGDDYVDGSGGGEENDGEEEGVWEKERNVWSNGVPERMGGREERRSAKSLFGTGFNAGVGVWLV